METGYSLYLRRPALESRDGEECHHGRKDIIKIEITVLPDPLTDHGTVDIPVLIKNEKPPRDERSWSGLSFTYDSIGSEHRMQPQPGHTPEHSPDGVSPLLLHV